MEKIKYLILMIPPIEMPMPMEWEAGLGMVMELVVNFQEEIKILI